ncbi:undecaprenyl-phosphate glucose phosphotransferase [[Clostridium] polysaccharolyticum]|uniref:Undecaprenyl-phosphate glucose phosphotransferase n=1 Tax=[Clostridium] polysaccharolyticum TaxID=29364 RepID=A0A1H9YMS1_9FIRM|nr:undecaprenyl-phosphate glucose phosphotransferase [[Clostridium] polysaccharolyticum]SES69913.1 Undecaprenyl-phosphate glucose phosphotransferase [[Clostridium] polysaccharolyticum]
MIKDNQKLFNRFHILIDAIFIVIAFRLTYYVRFESFLIYKFDWLNPFGYQEPFGIFARFLIFIVPVYLILYYGCHVYDSKRSKSFRYEIWDLFKANVFGIFFFTFLLVMLKKKLIYMRMFLTMFFCLNLGLTYINKIILRRVLAFYRKKGFNQKHVLVVGYSRTAERYINRILLNPEWGYHIHGILDDSMKPGAHYRNIKVLSTTDKLESILSQNQLDEIAITLSISEYAKLEKIVALCEKSGVHTKFIPDYNNIIPTKPYIEDLNGLPVINIRNVPLSNWFNKVLKRTFDIVGSFLAILVFSIPMLVTAIIIKTTSKGPLIFKQTRIGLHNKEFKMYKFRSMEEQAPDKEKQAWTTMNDPRVTPIGKFIRKTSIDELPQLFNVLKGDMSLVGPRPERPFFVEKFKEEIPRYMVKHQVRPGMTGWAQVSGYRGDTSIIKRIEHDLYYIENWSLGFDMKIMFLTVFKGFVNKNAY